LNIVDYEIGFPILAHGYILVPRYQIRVVYSWLEELVVRNRIVHCQVGQANEVLEQKEDRDKREDFDDTQACIFLEDQ
jgi:hypothetical protein